MWADSENAAVAVRGKIVLRAIMALETAERGRVSDNMMKDLAQAMRCRLIARQWREVMTEEGVAENGERDEDEDEDEDEDKVI